MFQIKVEYFNAQPNVTYVPRLYLDHIGKKEILTGQMVKFE